MPSAWSTVLRLRHDRLHVTQVLAPYSPRVTAPLSLSPAHCPVPVVSTALRFCLLLFPYLT